MFSSPSRKLSPHQLLHTFLNLFVCFTSPSEQETRFAAAPLSELLLVEMNQHLLFEHITIQNSSTAWGIILSKATQLMAFSKLLCCTFVCKLLKANLARAEAQPRRGVSGGQSEEYVSEPAFRQESAVYGFYIQPRWLPVERESIWLSETTNGERV